MRLASLARKIKVTPSKISEFAEGNGIALERGTNTKLTEEQINMVLQAFDAELPAEKKSEPLEETLNTTESTVEESKATEDVDPPKEESEEPTNTVASEDRIETEEKIVSPSVNANKEDASVIDEIAALDPDILEVAEIEKEPQQGAQTTSEINQSELATEPITEVEEVDDKSDVIKPPKIQLQGLTVKGKIDLPEPKPKEEPQEKEDKKDKAEPKVGPDGIVYTQGPKRDRGRKKPRKNQSQKSKDPNFNPIEAERRRKQREAEKEKKRRLEAQKRAKADHYKATVQKKQKPTPKKTVKKPIATAPIEKPVTQTVIPASLSKGKKEEKPVKKNALSRFWKWMNT